MITQHEIDAILALAASGGAGLFDPLGSAAAAQAAAEAYADGKVSNAVYDATAWNGVNDIAPSKNAIRDFLITLGTAAFTNSTAYDPAGSAAAAQAAKERKEQVDKEIAELEKK